MKTPKRIFALALALISLVSIFAFPASAAEAERNVKITDSGQVVDSLNGVDARYIPGTNNSNTGTYCCAQYVKNYYAKVFGVTVSNLLSNQTPVVSQKGYTFKQITSGIAIGDVVRLPGHWAIVKAVSGNKITLIEQNWKWASSGATYCKVNRGVTLGSTSGLVVFRLYKDGKSVNGSTTSDSNNSPVSLSYQSHLMDIGWQGFVNANNISGTTGQARRVEAIQICMSGISGDVTYQVHP